MTEYELLELFTMARSQLDNAIAQTITLNFALVVAIFYFLHRSGLVLKIGVFALYAIGWFVTVSSGSLAATQMVGIISDLQLLEQDGNAGSATAMLLATLNSSYNTAYVIAANAANFLLLIGAFLFLFFWKPPADRDER